MSDHPHELESLLSRVRAGDNEAVREVIDTYGSTVHREVRRRLNQNLRMLFDPTDISQEVWMDFFSKRVHRQTFRVETELNHYLAGMSRKFILELQRRHLDARKRDLRHQVPLDNSAITGNRDFVDPRPVPEEKASYEEWWDHLLQRLDPRSRRAVQMLRAGFRQQEVAMMLGVSERIVRRILERTRG